MKAPTASQEGVPKEKTGPVPGESAAAFRPSEAEFRIFTENSPDCIALHDTGLRHLYVNPAIARVVGLPQEAFVGKTVWDLGMPPEFGLGLEAVLRRVLECRSEQLCELILPTPAGPRCYHWRAVPVISADGSLNSILAIARDITQRKQTEEKLTEALRQKGEAFALLDAIFESAPIGIGVWDTDLRFVRINRALAEINGLPIEAQLGKTLSEVLPNLAQNGELVGSWRRVLETGQPMLNVERVGETPAHPGEQRQWVDNWYPVRVDGRTIGLAATVLDVTDQQRAQRQLRFLGAALQATANAVLITSADGTIQWVNDAFSRLTGYSAAEAIGQTPRLLKSGRHEPRYYQNLWSTILAGQVWQGEIVSRRKNGSLYNEELTITPVRDAGGAITHFIAIEQDVTERKENEERLRLQASMLDSVGQAVLATDLNLRLIYWNEAATRMFGWSRGEAVGRLLTEILPPQLSPERQAEITAALRRGEWWSGEFAVRRRDGELVPLHSTNSPLCNEAGQPIAIIGIGVDLTERFRAQEELRRAHADLEQKVLDRTVELVAANTALQKEIGERRALEARLLGVREAEQRRLGRDLHDGLCQQLAGVAYMGNSLQKQLARAAPKEAGALAQMTELIRAANIQAHDIAHGLFPVSLQADGLMAALRLLVAGFRKTYPIAARFECRKPVLVRDSAVAIHLYRIGQEAMSNAARHSDGTRVTVQLKENREAITLTVRDNGDGFPTRESRSRGMGLEAMHFRASIIGAVFDIHNDPKGGAVVTCAAPKDGKRTQPVPS